MSTSLLEKPKTAVDLLRHKTRVFWHKWQSETRDEYYLRMTKQHADPEAWVGPADLFEYMRAWQFEMLKEQGLERGDVLIDLGCGVLRAGIPLIEYLDRGNYYGLDISRKALLDGHRRVHEHGLETADPTLIQNDDVRLREVGHLEADWLLAQSVWTHLPPDEVQTCIENLDRCLGPNGAVIATINQVGGEPRVTGREDLDYGYSISWLREQADGYDVTRLDYDHPNDQTVVRFDRR